VQKIEPVLKNKNSLDNISAWFIISNNKFPLVESKPINKASYLLRAKMTRWGYQKMVKRSL
jgi:hypothetical protein